MFGKGTADMRAAYASAAARFARNEAATGLGLDAAVLVDVQARYCLGRTKAEAACDRIAGLLPALRSARIPIYALYMTEDGVPPESVDFHKYRLHTLDVPFRKHRVSAFEDSTLARVFRVEGYRNLLVMGVNTSVCVKETVLDGLKAGFGIWLARDCIADNAPRDTRGSIAEMTRNGARLITSEDVRAAISQDYGRGPSGGPGAWVPALR